MASDATGGEKCKLYLGWLFAALTGAVLPLFFFYIGPIFDSFGPETTPEETEDKVAELCLIMGILTIAITIFSVLQNYFLMSASASITAKLRTRYLQAVLDKDSAWFDQNNYLEYAARLSREVDQIQAGIGQKTGQIIYSMAMSLSGIVVGFYKGWSLALAMLGIAPIMLAGMTIFAMVQQKNALTTMRAYGQSAGYAEQALSAVRIVVSFGQEALEIENYSRFLARVREAGIKASVANGASLGFFFCTIYLCYAYAFLLGAIWVDEGYWNHAEDREYKAGDCMAVFFGVLIGLFALGGTGPAANAVNQAKAAGKSAFEVIDNVPAINVNDKNAQKHKISGDIEFKEVTFYYPTRPDQAVMKQFSHVFPKGTTTAIVGPSGSGKSTTIQLVERFYDPNEGQVLIDGKDLKTLDLKNYRQQIGYVGQEPVLFNTTFRQNILMGKPDATDAEIEDALRKTNSWDFVQKAGGIDANVGAGGGMLSGGQKQRIALARAFIKKPCMLIFDEATSALDKVNEAEVQRAIDQMKQELGTVTTLVIAHRLSTVRNADNIIVMKKGKIAEQGTHDSLVAIPGGVYAKLAANEERTQSQEQ